MTRGLATTSADARERVVDADERRLLIDTRRDLHRHPELGFHERRTAAIVAHRLRAAGYVVQTGVARTGVVGTLAGAGDGPLLLLRADMDALPIQEESAQEYASVEPGIMHACGHDAHVAIGLAVAERLARTRSAWRGGVRYVFQPAEEFLGGARLMIAEGVLDGVDAALGLHVWTPLPVGTIAVTPGPFMAGAVQFRITVAGRGGHTGSPHETVDALLAACEIVSMLQGVVGRTVSPLDAAALTVGNLHAGTAPNAIAATACMQGFARAFTPSVLDLLKRHVQQVTTSVCAAFGAEGHVTFDGASYSPTVNDSWMARQVHAAAAEVVGDDSLVDNVRTLAAEDFSELASRVPGCFFFVGAGRSVGTSAPHHSSRFDVCEEALPIAVDVLEAAARRVLAGWPHTP